MILFDKIHSRIKNFSVGDFGIMKVCLVSFTLMVAKLFPVVLTLSWGWYAIIFAITYAYLLYFIFGKK
jgi:hypothetical protein